MAAVSIGIVTLTNRTLGPVARLFIENARDVAKAAGEAKMICAMFGSWHITSISGLIGMAAIEGSGGPRRVVQDRGASQICAPDFSGSWYSGTFSSDCDGHAAVFARPARRCRVWRVVMH
jgi:hypothetical protein